MALPADVRAEFDRQLQGIDTETMVLAEGGVGAVREHLQAFDAYAKGRGYVVSLMYGGMGEAESVDDCMICVGKAKPGTTPGHTRCE